MDHPDNKYFINDLPIELIIKILDFLPTNDLTTAFGVCKKWFDALNDKQFTSRLRFAVKCKEIQIHDDAQVDSLKQLNESIVFNAIDILSKSVLSISMLTIRNADFSDPKYINMMNTSWQSFGQKMVHLELYECVFKLEGLISLISIFENVKNLSLNKMCYLMNKGQREVQDKQLTDSLSQICGQLDSLDLSGDNSFGLCDRVFVCLARFSTQLTVFNVSGCKIVFHNAIIRRFYFDNKDCWEEPSEYVFSFKVLMKFFQLNGSKLKVINFSNTKICKDHLYQLLRCDYLKSLETLYIRNCIELTENEVKKAKMLRPQMNLISS